MCYFIYNNIYFISIDFFDDDFNSFVEETGQKQLVQIIADLKSRNAGLAQIVVSVLKYVDYYSNEEIEQLSGVLSTNFFYTPSRGDIVVLEADRIPNQATMNYGEPIIKRVIALEGDTIKFDFENGQVFLKKAGETEFELLDEDYIAAPTVAKLDRHSGEEHVVPEHCVFVMGDNRNRSLDSRSLMLGDVDTDLIMGRAFVRLFPIKNFTWL